MELVNFFIYPDEQPIFLEITELCLNNFLVNSILN